MTDILASLGLALALFVATNVDDLFILIALFAHPGLRPFHVVTGQLIGMAVLIGASLLGSRFAFSFAPHWVGLLGFVPLGLGLFQILQRLRGIDEEHDELEVSQAGRLFAVVLITIANGGDNVAIYVPVLATQSVAEQALLAAAFMVMTAVWCAAAYALVHHPRLRGPVRRYVAPLAPVVLIGLGIYILLESGALTWLWSRTR